MTRRLLQNRVFWSRVGLLAMLSFAGTSLAQPPGAGAPRRMREAFKEQVEQLEETWRTARMSGDVATMDKLLSDDYVGITLNGQVVTKMQELDHMQRRQAVLNKITLTDVKVKLIGTTAIVQGLTEVDGTNEGEPVHGTYRYTRVYSRLPSGVWKITNFESTRVGPPPPQPANGRRPPSGNFPSGNPGPQ